MNRLLLVFLLIPLSSMPATSAIDSKNWEIRFGIMSVDANGGCSLNNETVKIPMKLKKSGFRYGFNVKSKNKQSFEGKWIAYLPNSPKETTGDIDLLKPNRTDEGHVFHFPEQTYIGNWKVCSWFDDGDPTGNWKFEIYIDGNLMKTINFEVVP